MTYYHASPTGGLQSLEPRKSPFFDKPAQVCLTALRAMALFYLIRNYEYAYGSLSVPAAEFPAKEPPLPVLC